MPEAAAPDRIRVLIVDDHQMVAESLVRLLGEDPQISVVGTAATGAEGLTLARAERPDVVVMDFQLPDTDGASATRRLKDEGPDLEVIALTGSDRPGAYQAMLDAGSSAWVRKTRAVQELRAAVHRVHVGEAIDDEELADLPTVDEIAVAYQPILELASNRIVGFEALARWNHPHRGVLSPAEFLPRAQETGFIDEVDRIVSTVAVQQLATWRAQLPAHADLWVAANVSASGLNRPDRANAVAAVLDDAGVPPEALALEITETVLLEDSSRVLGTLNDLKDIGVRLALDDFGTAFSSLSYLQRFPFDELKLDTTFTAGLPDAPRSKLLVEAVLQLAATLEVPVVAEGIERPEQAQCLREAGCQLGQGYLYSAPVPAPAAERLLLEG